MNATVDVGGALVALVVALAVAATAVIVSAAEIFRPLREKLAGSAHAPLRWLGKLVRCSFCTSVWVAAAFVIVMRPHAVMSSHPAADLVATWLAVVALAGFLAPALRAAQVAMARQGSCCEQLRQAKATLLKAREIIAAHDRAP